MDERRLNISACEATADSVVASFTLGYSFHSFLVVVDSTAATHRMCVDILFCVGRDTGLGDFAPLAITHRVSVCVCVCVRMSIVDIFFQ
jgi:hypothetical protein